MTRQTVIYTERGPKTFHNVRYDTDGSLVFVLVENSVTNVDLDFTSMLESGETILTATTDTSVISNLTVASPLVTMTVTALKDWNEGTITITLSSNEVIQQRIRVETHPPVQKQRYLH